MCACGSSLGNEICKKRFDNPETFADLDGHCGAGGLPGAPSSIQRCDNPGNNAPATTGEGQHPQPQRNGTNTPTSTSQQAQAAQQHVVRFAGDRQDRKSLKASWHYMITHSNHARALLKTALKSGDVTIRPTKNDAYYDPSDRSINVDPNFHPLTQTTAGPEPAPTTVILGHELGHAAGPKDDGPNHMNNVIKSENPIRRDLGLPDRTKY